MLLLSVGGVGNPNRGQLHSDMFSRPYSELLLSSQLYKQIQGHRVFSACVLTVRYSLSVHTDVLAGLDDSKTALTNIYV